VILFTSARPQEGKTILSANLAWSFASIHDKTLLIDTDLRRGRMHKLLEADNSTGMSNYLQGVSTLDEVIQKTQVPGLDVITRGPIIPGSTEKLCTEDFMNLVKQLRRRYQRVVIDSPPVLGLSETSSLQRAVDGTVLVVRAEKTPRRELKMAYDLLRKSGAKFFGFVLNSLDLNRLGNYYNYYYYSSYYYSTFDDDEVDEEDYSAARKPSKRV
jgi:capsular exopolysaccharide synthesis family protein